MSFVALFDYFEVDFRYFDHRSYRALTSQKFSAVKESFADEVENIFSEKGLKQFGFARLL